MRWCIEKNNFPSVFVLRRYIKLIYLHCKQENLLDLTLEEIRQVELPFDIFALPYEFPPLSELALAPAVRDTPSEDAV